MADFSLCIWFQSLQFARQGGLEVALTNARSWTWTVIMRAKALDMPLEFAFQRLRTVVVYIGS